MASSHRTRKTLLFVCLAAGLAVGWISLAPEREPIVGVWEDATGDGRIVFRPDGNFVLYVREFGKYRKFSGGTWECPGDQPIWATPHHPFDAGNDPNRPLASLRYAEPGERYYLLTYTSQSEASTVLHLTPDRKLKTLNLLGQPDLHRASWRAALLHHLRWFDGK